jgi:hypothetical protein
VTTRSSASNSPRAVLHHPAHAPGLGVDAGGALCATPAANVTQAA